MARTIQIDKLTVVCAPEQVQEFTDALSAGIEGGAEVIEIGTMRILALKQPLTPDDARRALAQALRMSGPTTVMT